MTQAYNLSQLGNRVNTSGQLNASTGLSGQAPVANGGTGLATLTANNVILGNGASTPIFIAPGTAGNALVSNGTTWISGTPTLAGSLIGYQIFTSSGTYTKATNNPGFVIVYVIGGGGGKSSNGVGTDNGGTSSFGTFCSATGGLGFSSGLSGINARLGGVGSGGDLNISGQTFTGGARGGENATIQSLGAFGLSYGNSHIVYQAAAKSTVAILCAAGGGGSMERIQASAMGATVTVTVGAAGNDNNNIGGLPPTAGVVIVWEYA